MPYCYPRGAKPETALSWEGKGGNLRSRATKVQASETLYLAMVTQDVIAMLFFLSCSFNSFLPPFVNSLALIVLVLQTCRGGILLLWAR